MAEDTAIHEITMGDIARVATPESLVYILERKVDPLTGSHRASVVQSLRRLVDYLESDPRHAEALAEAEATRALLLGR